VEANSGKFAFAANQSPKNSVQVLGRRTHDSPSGPVPLFFGNLMGMRFFEPQCIAAATYIERDVVLVVDRSGSMKGDKFLSLVDAIDVFVKTLQETPVDEQVGLASYSDTATSDVYLTENLDEISAGIRGLPVDGYTSISRGMNAGRVILDNSRGIDFVERTMIVMTDGLHNRGPEPREEALLLAAAGVTIHTITFGADADQKRMIEVAAIGGGRHYHAEDGSQLREIYREIALTLSTLMTQ
jgi:Mg-chelatase subunit ChlD